MNKTEIAREVAARLNSLIEADSLTINALVNTRIECGAALTGFVSLRYQDNLYAIKGNAGYTLGVVGLLNAVLGLEDDDRLCVIKNDETRVISHFGLLADFDK